MAGPWTWLLVAALLTEVDANGVCRRAGTGTESNFCSAMTTAITCCEQVCEVCAAGTTCGDNYCLWEQFADETTVAEETAYEETDDETIFMIVGLVFSFGCCGGTCAIGLCMWRQMNMAAEQRRKREAAARMAASPVIGRPSPMMMAPAPVAAAPPAATPVPGTTSVASRTTAGTTASSAPGTTSVATSGAAPGSASVATAATVVSAVVNVRCGGCEQVVEISAAGTGVAQFACPLCGKVNEFELPDYHAVKSDKSIKVEYPDYWKSDGSTRKFESEENKIKDAMQSLLDSTWKNQWTRDRGKDGKVSKFEVVMVQRNENPKLWEPYCRLRGELARKMKIHDAKKWEVKTQSETEGTAAQILFDRANLREDANEFYLFHGTKPSAAKAICDDDFKVNLAGCNAGSLYGPGLYFAEASSKSDEYAQDDKEGIFAGLFGMIVCRIAAGNINYNDQVSPKVQDLVDSVLTDKTHHCILGDREKCRGTYREFIIFDKDQAYPEYVVIYRRIPAESE